MGDNGSGQNQYTKLKQTRLTPMELGKIERMYNTGLSTAAIARKTGRHYNTIAKLKPGTRKPVELANLPERALEDFGLFRAHYLGRVTTPWQERAAEKIVELLLSENEEYLVLNCPPGMGKSTLLTDLCTWLIARNRAIRIMYGSASQTSASNYTNQVMDNIQRPDLVKAKIPDLKLGLAQDGLGNLTRDYGQFKPANKARWTKEKFVVAQEEGRTAQDKDPTMVAFGRDSKFLGGRFDLVVWDDLVEESNVTNVEAREKLIRWWSNTAETRLEPGGLNVLVGQRLGSEDLYRYCLDLPSGLEDAPELEDLIGGDKPYSRKYHHIMFPAHDDEKCHDPSPDNPDHLRTGRLWPDGCLLDPRRMSGRKMAQLKAAPFSQWETVYQQKDSDPTDNLVRPEWVDGGKGKDGIQYVGCKDYGRALRQAPDGLGTSWSVMSVDPSPARYWSLQWWLCHEETKTMVLMDHLNTRMSAPDWIDRDSNGLFHGVAEDWVQASRQLGRPITHMIVEKNAAQEFMLQTDAIKKWSSSRGVLIVPHHTGVNKSDAKYGVGTLAPVWMHGRVRLPWADNTSREASARLINESLKWRPEGSGGTDDCVMAMWFVHHQWPKINPQRSNVYQMPRPSWLRSA